jgi:hypothetical protein
VSAERGQPASVLRVGRADTAQEKVGGFWTSCRSRGATGHLGIVENRQRKRYDARRRGRNYRRRRRARKPGARASTATRATRKQTRTRREVDTTGRHAGARDQSHNPRERRRVRHPPGIKELASDTSPITGGIRTRERAEFDTKTEAHKRDATRHGARRRASTPGRRGETMAAPEAGAGGDRRGEGA